MLPLELHCKIKLEALSSTMHRCMDPWLTSSIRPQTIQHTEPSRSVSCHTYLEHVMTWHIMTWLGYTRNQEMTRSRVFRSCLWNYYVTLERMACCTHVSAVSFWECLQTRESKCLAWGHLERHSKALSINQQILEQTSNMVQSSLTCTNNSNLAAELDC